MTCGKPCECESYRAHLLSVGFAASAMPTRSPDAVAITERERRWSKDMPAYKALRADGVQPKQIDGSARLQAMAESTYEVESGNLLSTRRDQQTARSVLDDLGKTA